MVVICLKCSCAMVKSWVAVIFILRDGEHPMKSTIFICGFPRMDDNKPFLSYVVDTKVPGFRSVSKKT